MFTILFEESTLILQHLEPVYWLAVSEVMVEVPPTVGVHAVKPLPAPNSKSELMTFCLLLLLTFRLVIPEIVLVVVAI